MHKFSGTMGFQRLIKTIKRTGGTPGPDSVSSSDIIDGTISTSDISDGAITPAKLSSELQTNLTTTAYYINNLLFPGWYGTFTITNNNASNPETITFTVEERSYNQLTQSTDTRSLLGSTTLAHNQDEVITLAIHERLTNDESIIRISYTLSGGSIDTLTTTGLNNEDNSVSHYDFTVQSAFRHNGNISLSVTIVV